MDDFPQDIRQFVLDNITSVEQLEVLLLLLQRTPEKEWDAASVSRELYTQPEAAAKRLADLAALGLLAHSEGPTRLYRYAPRTPAQAQLVASTAEAYRLRRVAIVGLIYSRPTSEAQAFADAFKFRKEK